MKLYTASETRKIDSLAIKEENISGYSLMQSAAEFSLDVIVREFPEVKDLVVFCSKGKNSTLIKQNPQQYLIKIVKNFFKLH